MLTSASQAANTTTSQNQPSIAHQGIAEIDEDSAPFALFDATPKTRKEALAAGHKASSFCASCHGEDGNSRFEDVPNLAGQHPAYLFNQINKFASGERKNAWMQGVVTLMNEDQRRKIVYYYSNSTAMPRTTSANIAVGKAVFARSCAICHGANAHGTATIPRLAGQPAKYLDITLTRYRDRSGERVFLPMSAVVGSLPQKDIDAVIAYLTSAP